MAQPTFIANEIIVMFEPGTPQIIIDEFFTDNHLIEIDSAPLLDAYLTQVDPIYNWPTGPTSNNAQNPINGIIGNNTTSGINGLGLNIITDTHPTGFTKEYDVRSHHPLDVCGPESYSIDIEGQNINGVRGAIFDTGVKYHSILGEFFNPQNLGTNIIDPSSTAKDDHDPGHGSHNSSTMAAYAPPTMSNFIDLKAFKTHEKNGLGTVWHLMKGIAHAIDQDIDVVNMSLGFSERYQHRFDPKAPLRLSIDIARDVAGILFIAAAGNEAKDNDDPFHYSNYPASYLSENIISVAAIGCENKISDFSNTGVTSVDIAAPGENIWGLTSFGGFASLSGTSMSCAFVSRVAVQLGTLQATFDWAKVKCAIITGSKMDINLYGKVLSNGYLSAETAKSILLGDCTLPPGPPSNVATERSNEIEDAYLANADQINIQMASDQAVNIRIFNALGQTLSSEQIQFKEGLNTYDLPWEQTASPSFGTAMYFINLQYNGQYKTIKIVR